MKPRVAVFKFASCDGCQLQFLNAEDELLKLAGQVDFVYFPEARSRALEGPYDIAFVEGSITTPGDARRIVKVREESRYLVTIGACATAGGIQALRNWADIEQYRRVAYPSPEFISTLSTSTPIRNTFASTSKCGAAPSISINCLAWCARCCPKHGRFCQRTACAWSVNGAATYAWWLRAVSRAWGP
jgi:Ni,Fe-hydrogenase III small subunit